jgi:hypothetical protein
MKTTWRKAMSDNRGWDDKNPHYDAERDGSLLAVAPDESVLDVEFESGFGTSEGPAFTAWTATRVYFPVVYDGSEWVGSAPRNPCDEACEHVGGQ